MIHIAKIAMKMHVLKWFAYDSQSKTATRTATMTLIGDHVSLAKMCVLEDAQDLSQWLVLEDVTVALSLPCKHQLVSQQ